MDMQRWEQNAQQTTSISHTRIFGAATISEQSSHPPPKAMSTAARHPAARFRKIQRSKVVHQSQNTRAKPALSSIQSSIADNNNSESSADGSEVGTKSSSELENEEEIITIGGPKKPRITHYDVTEGAQDLRSRLDALLPQLAASNDLLAGNGGGFSMEDVEDGEQHIEMNLGLGVLEEKREDGSSSSDGDSDEASIDEGEEADMLFSSGTVQRSAEEWDTNVVSKLLGRSRRGRRPGIDDLG